MPLRGKIINHLFALLWLLCPFPNHPATGETSSICTNRIYKTTCLWLNGPFACLLKTFRLPLRIRAGLVGYLYIVWNSFGIIALILKQECIQVGCVPPAYWPYPVVLGGGSAQPSCMQTSLEADPPGCRPPGFRHPLDADPPPVCRPLQMQAPQDATLLGCRPPPLDADLPDADPSQMQDVGYTFVNTICLQLFMNEMLIPFLLWSSDKSIYLRKIFDCHWFKNQFTCCRT